jgi:hypothetical protein
MLDHAFLFGVPVEAHHRARPACDGGAGLAAIFEVAGEAFDVDTTNVEQPLLVLPAPGGELAQIQHVVLAGEATVSGQKNEQRDVLNLAEHRLKHLDRGRCRTGHGPNLHWHWPEASTTARTAPLAGGAHCTTPEATVGSPPPRCRYGWVAWGVSTTFCTTRSVRFGTPEWTTCSDGHGPRPSIMIGGGGEQKTWRFGARYADACNLFAASPDEVAHKLDVLRSHCDEAGRDPSSIHKTILYVQPTLATGDVDGFLTDMEAYAAIGTRGGHRHAHIRPPRPVDRGRRRQGHVPTRRARLLTPHPEEKP